MRRFQIRSLLLPALAFVLFAGSIAAQDKSPALLNTLEVQQLVKRAEPADNARLAAHFTALADGYVAEAKRHTSMSQSSVGNPSRNLGSGMSAHCNNSRISIRSRRLRCVTSQRTTRSWRLVPQRRCQRRAPASRGTGARTPTVQELNALAAKQAHLRITTVSRSTSRRWRSGIPRTPMSTRRRRIRTAARRSRRRPALRQSFRLSKAADEATDATSMHKQLASVAR